MRRTGNCGRSRTSAAIGVRCWLPEPRCANVIRCPYHAWTYSLDGRLLSQPEFEGVEDWNRASVCLPEFRVEIWGPFVFVNLDRHAPALLEVFGSIPVDIAAMGCPVEKLHYSDRRDYVIQCNWKVYIDNYLEGYHLPAAHPSLFRELDYQQYRVETHRHYSSQIAPIRARADSPVRAAGTNSRTAPAARCTTGSFPISC